MKMIDELTEYLEFNTCVGDSLNKEQCKEFAIEIVLWIANYVEKEILNDN